jgi:hypothetical protein
MVIGYKYFRDPCEDTARLYVLWQKHACSMSWAPADKSMARKNGKLALTC